MKNRKLLMLVMLVITALSFGACGNKQISSGNYDSTKKENVSRDNEKTESDDKGGETEAKADEEEHLVNPLDGMETVYSGELQGEDNETIRLINCFLETCPKGKPDLNSILGVTAADFDGNGTSEAFIFVGSSDELCYVGNYYFVDGTTTVMLGENLTWDENNETMGVYSFDGFIDCGSKKYAYYNAYYTTAAPSYVYEVVDGKAVPSILYGLGSVRTYEDGTVTVTYSSYDGMFDKDSMIVMGHSWKPYFFHFDEQKNTFVEDSGEYIALEAIDEKCGFDLYEQIASAGYGFIDAIYRDNGVLIVDLFLNGDYSVDFYNVLYDCNSKCFLETWDVPVASAKFTDALWPGKYAYALTEDAVMAGFDHVFYEKLTVELKNESDIICFSEENDGVIVSCNGIERMLFRNGGTDGMIDSVGKYEISVGNSSIDKVY